MSIIYKVRPNIFIAMVWVGALGLVISLIGFFLMGGNDVIVAAAGVGAIVAITNLANKLLEDDFEDQSDAIIGANFRAFQGRIRPNIIIAMSLIAILGISISLIGSLWVNPPVEVDGKSMIIKGNEAIVAAAGVGAIVAIANLAGKILEQEFSIDQPDSTTGWLAKLRPNIVLAMIVVGALGIGISLIGLQLEVEGLVAAAGVGSLVAITNLAGKILENEFDSDNATNTSNFLSRLKPNILLAIFVVGGIGLGVSIFGLLMKQEGLIAAAGVGSIVAITNLAGKILVSEKN